MEAVESQINQVLVKLLDGKHKVLNFDTSSISVSNIKDRIQTLTSIPSHFQLLLSNNSRILQDHHTLSLTQLSEIPQFPNDRDVNQYCSPVQSETAVSCNGFEFGAGKFPVVVNLLLRLRGGKGGFGSLLRGAATKAGQKKSDNNDACRDINGRRLRHVNAEKKIIEWNERAEERKLEKLAEKYIKDKAKEVAKSGRVNGSDSSEKYVAKYREDSAKCMEEVEKSVRESLLSLKRKKDCGGSESDSKRFKIWLGKRKFYDSDDEDDSDEDEEMQNEKSVIIDNGSQSDSGKEEGGSSGSVTNGKLDTGSLGQGSSESGSEEEDTVVEKSVSSVIVPDGCSEDENSKTPDNLEENTDPISGDTDVPHESHSEKMEDVAVTEHEAVPIPEDGSTIKFWPVQEEVPTSADVQGAFHRPDVSVAELKVGPVIESGPVQQEELVSSTTEIAPIIESAPVQKEELALEVQEADKPLNFDEYNSAEELQVLGIERLKVELQKRGLKCGGTLQERASRLFLLKTTPLDKLPKKLLAKK